MNVLLLIYYFTSNCYYIYINTKNSITAIRGNTNVTLIKTFS